MRLTCLADGASPHTQRFLDYCLGRGWGVQLITFQPAKCPGVQVVFLPAGRRAHEGGNWHLVLLLPWIRAAIRRAAPDLVVAHYAASYGVLAALAAGRRPVAIWGYGSDLLVSPRRHLALRWGLRWALRRAAAVIVVSPQLRDAVLSLAPGLDGRTLVAPFGVDPLLFNRNGRQGGTVGPRCIALRGFVPNSQPLLVVQAFRLLAYAHPMATLVMTGAGPLRERVEQTARRCGVEDRVQILGMVDTESVPDLLRASDIYIAPTFSDGTSVSLLEAMACGVCPVVSDTPANRWWVEDGVNGLLVAPTAGPDVWAERIAWAWSNSEWRRQVGERNAEIVAQRGILRTNLDEAWLFVLRRTGRAGGPY